MKILKSLFLFVILVCPTWVEAQKYSIGIAASPSLTNLRAENAVLKNDKLYKPDLGFYAGINIRRQFGRWAAIRSGFEYEHVAAKINANFTDENGNLLPNATVVLHFDYTQIPLLFEATVGKKTKGILQVGQTFGFLASSSASFLGFPLSAGIPPNIEVGFDDRTFNQSLILGLGAEFPFKKASTLQILCRKSIGITDINNENDSIPTKTTSLFLSIGVQYHFINKN